MHANKETVKRASCMLELMNSLKESSCCRTRPFSSKKAWMTAQASSCRRPQLLAQQQPQSALAGSAEKATCGQKYHSSQ